MQSTIRISPELSLRPLAALMTQLSVANDLGLDDLEILTLATVELAEAFRTAGDVLTAEIAVSPTEVRVSILPRRQREVPQARDIPVVAAGFSSLQRTERDGAVWITAVADLGSVIA